MTKDPQNVTIRIRNIQERDLSTLIELIDILHVDYAVTNTPSEPAARS